MKTNKRKLTVEPFEPMTARNVRAVGSQIRIKGQWLSRLGFPPGASVELTAISPGVLEIRLCAPEQLVAEDFRVVTGALAQAAARYDEAKPCN